MSATISFFPVGNGDMTLIKLADTDATTLLIDVNIRQAADNPKENVRDVAKDLRERLKKDRHGRPYVDALLLSHPDQDHCSGLLRHFHLGPITEYADDNKKEFEKKIVVRELWSSPIVFRRASKEHPLCEDAKAFNAEAKRRVKVNKDQNFQNVEAGNRILILGEDENGKTDDLSSILVKVDEVFSKINGKTTLFLEARLLAPLPKTDDADEDTLSKNHSSTILNLKIAASLTESDGCRFLTGGDAEVAIWERIWIRHKNEPNVLTYDLLQTPHHCSWHSLSYDSWSEKHKEANLSKDAHSALSQARSGARIVSSSKPILDDDNDPPCIGAKNVYVEIINQVNGIFLCTGENPHKDNPEPIEFEVSQLGVSFIRKNISAVSIITSSPAHKAG